MTWRGGSGTQPRLFAARDCAGVDWQRLWPPLAAVRNGELVAGGLQKCVKKSDSC